MSSPTVWDTMGLRASRSLLVSFEGTVLREDRRCPPSTGRRPNHIGAGLAFLSLGIADAAEEALISHSRSRVNPATGQPLAEMQWLQFEVANDIARDVAQVALKAGGGSGFLRTSLIQRLFRDAQAG
ncbi:hypothetical protein [Amycolatopsis sp. cmx-11-12]|uniref:hypothetical protein n=1 Tax=Amycolatopsis sp. cmx-11-12 TaxID=2785795 RepID=UPI0039174D0F